jgi:hypothetical protein
VLRLVIGEGMKLAFIGALLGLGGALALTRLLKTLLFGVDGKPRTIKGASHEKQNVALRSNWFLLYFDF